MNQDDRRPRQRIEALLSQHIGLNVDSLGATALTQIILQEMREVGLADFAAYWQYLEGSEAGREQLIEATVVPETSFFRNPASFDYLRRYLLEQSDRRFWRILSLPCSTGEEPYSIAMSLLQAGVPPQSFSIDGVDISAIALAKARQGIYGGHSFRQSAARFASSIQQFFHRDGPHYCISRQARSPVGFFQGNLAHAGCLCDRLPYDIIFCRNLLIYFHDAARDRALNNLYRLLVPEGLLFVGHAETRQIDRQRFSAIRAPHAFVYRKRSVALPPLPLGLSEAETPLPLGLSEAETPLPLGLSEAETPLPLGLSEAEAPLPPKATPDLADIRTLADRGILSEALEQCDRYLQEYPTDPGAYLLLGVIYEARGEDNLAEIAFQKALFLEPHCEEALLHLLLLSQQNGDRAEVRRWQQRLARLDSGN
ncbi:MAG: methyltransferase domain-containing protein [Cyanobacteria bacterium SBLK]|nr:methyltransferase domain-containing protein [Cyanobacteria bacterium SBLK]